MLHQIGDFKILSKLGEGGMGIVYKAKQGSKVVALKTISPSISKDSHFQKRFLREMKVISELDHINIVKAIDFGVDLEQSTYFVALEFVEGESLENRIRKLGRLPLLSALEIAKAVAQGLQYAHERNIVHRDIKPDNIMVGIFDGVKITDFGLVKNFEEAGMTAIGSVIGTPLYMAPELASADKFDIRVDIYSLGITLYFMLAGRPPFMLDNAMKLIQAHALEPLPDIRQFNPEIPNEVIQLIEKMSAKEPDDRFATPQEVCDAITRIQRKIESSSNQEAPAEGQKEPEKSASFVRSTKVIHPEVRELGEKFVELGIATSDQIKGLFDIEYVPDKKTLAKLLINYGITTEKAIVQAFAKKKNIVVMEADQANIPPEALKIVTPVISTKYGCVPVKIEGKELYLASESPFTQKAQEELQSLTGFNIRGVMSTKSAILKVQSKYKLLVCLKCHESLLVEWKYCPFCGRAVDAPFHEGGIKTNPTFLLAEDLSGLPIDRENLKKLFPESKFIYTASGKEVVDLAEKNLPDVILMDLKLPEVSGMMVCMSLRNDPKTAHIPILMFTSDEKDQQMKEKAYVAGVDEFLSKPLNFQELKVKLERILKASTAPISSQHLDDMLSTSKVMIGQLDMMSIPELIQTMVRSAKTGTLVLSKNEDKGEIYFKEGHVINAKVKEMEGDEAFYKILTWSHGKFRFRQGAPGVEQKIHMDTMGLLMEGCRLMDEQKMS